MKNSSELAPVAVLGAGSFGTAIANLLAENRAVLLYARRPEAADSMREQRSSAGQPLHEGVEICTDLQEICERSYCLYPIVPSAAFHLLLDKLRDFLRPDHMLIHGTKGLHLDEDAWQDLEAYGSIKPSRVLTMSELILRETVAVKVGSLQGPNLASEIAAGQPGATVLCSPFDQVINAGKSHLRGSRFQIFGSHDLRGIELAGVLKNILAIGSGIVRGLGMGENLRALFLTRGLSEIIYMSAQLGVEVRSFLGLAGIGDIIATCAGPQSRNYSVGFRLAKGEKLADILESMEEPAEGVQTLKIAMGLSKNLGLSTPIISILHRSLFKDLPVDQGLKMLMRLPVDRDVDFI